MTALVYAGSPIGERDEMLCLTDMWRASGESESKRPFEWARYEGAQFIDFVAESLNTGQARIWISENGRYGGTWAHWQIALAYAKYLSPEFHAWCNDVVRAHMQRTHVPAVPSGSPAELEAAFRNALVPVVDQINAVKGDVYAVKGDVQRIDGNVVYIMQEQALMRERVDSIVPRRDFPEEAKKLHRWVVRERYNGECPCCRRSRIVADDCSGISGAINYDHFNGRERNGVEDGWAVCCACNQKLRSDDFKREARDRFNVFQRDRRELAAGQQAKKKPSGQLTLF